MLRKKTQSVLLPDPHLDTDLAVWPASRSAPGVGAQWGNLGIAHVGTRADQGDAGGGGVISYQVNALRLLPAKAKQVAICAQPQLSQNPVLPTSANLLVPSCTARIEIAAVIEKKMI
jgi:hypothetical protein